MKDWDERGLWIIELLDHFEKLRAGVLATWTLYISSISVRVFISLLITRDIKPNTSWLKHTKDFIAYVSENGHQVKF